MASGLNSWKQDGAVSLWRYTENPRKFGGWHITADSAGVASLVTLINLLRQSDPDQYRTISITAPSTRTLRVPNFQRGDAPTVSPDKWRISLAPGTEDVWSFPVALDPAALTVGGLYVAKLIAALEGIPRGEGDYSIGAGKGTTLSLWWQAGGT